MRRVRATHAMACRTAGFMVVAIKRVDSRARKLCDITQTNHLVRTNPHSSMWLTHQRAAVMSVCKHNGEKIMFHSDYPLITQIEPYNW